MEMLGPSFCSAPQTETSHLRSSQYANPAKAATRPAADVQHHHHHTEHHHQQPPSSPSSSPSSSSAHRPLSAPASQESIASARSDDTASTQPRLDTGSSSLSQLTAYTDQISPVSSQPNAPFDHEQRHVVSSKPALARVHTPDAPIGNGTLTAGSPMSLTSPVSTNGGTKRTASGHVKNAPSTSSTPPTTYTEGRRRADSISSTSSRAGELARDLKTRLGYAMAKVHNGWEHRNLSEVEELAAHQIHAHRRSMSHLDYSRRPASYRQSQDVLQSSVQDEYQYGHRGAMDSAVYPSKRHSGTYASIMASSSQPNPTTAPRLQPAADIRPTTSHRHTYQQPSLSQPTPTSHASAMSPPRTPVNGYSHPHPRRPPTIRTETQTAEAERDALQALFQLGSPHASQMNNHHASQASSSQASPLRSEFAATPRRVTFARSESDSSAQLSASDDERPQRESTDANPAMQTV